MAKSPVVYAIEGKLGWLRGELVACERRAETLRSLIGHVSETLAMYGSDLAAICGIRPSKKGVWFKHGHGARAVLDVFGVMRAIGAHTLRLE